jgi:CHAD domain-containing protein
MARSSKWIDGIYREVSLEEAARRSLEARLAAVVQRLPQAAHMAERDIEHVHRLRVGTRRAVAAIKLYRELLPPKQYRWMKKRLDQVRSAAGNARDLDVLGERLRREHEVETVEPVLGMIADFRAAVQPEIVEIAERCRRDDRFVRKTSKLLDKIGSTDTPSRPQTLFQDWAPRKLHEAAAEFFAAVPHDVADAAAMHRFRIRAKAMRYTIELLAAGLDPPIQDEYYPVVEELQERLGKINDHMVARDSLIDWLDDADDAAERTLLCELAYHEIASSRRAIAEFGEWWTPEKLDWLRQGLSDYTANAKVSAPAAPR